MSEIETEYSGKVLRIQINRPLFKNALTSGMHIALADIFADASKDDDIQAVLLQGAGESFCAGCDVEDLLKNLAGGGNFPQTRLMKALADFDKPIVAAVQGEVIGAGITMLTQCDLVFARESTKFQIAFLNFALVPGFASGWSTPARIGRLQVAGLKLLGPSFDARHATRLGLVTHVATGPDLLSMANYTARELAQNSTVAMRRRHRVVKRPFRDQLDVALKIESEKFTIQSRPVGPKNEIVALLEWRRPEFAEIGTLSAAA